MNKKSIKPILLEWGLLSEVSEDWKKDFLTGAKGMPKTSEDVLSYALSIYAAAFNGEQNITVINKKMMKWLVEKIIFLTGRGEDISANQKDALITVMTWFKVAGSEGNIPKMPLEAAYEFSKKKLAEKEKQNTSLGKGVEPPVSKVEEEGLGERVYVIPDGSGRFWIKVNPKRAGDFFDKLCDLNRAYGVGCQSKHSGMMHAEHRKSNRISYTLLGPEAGKSLPITTLMALSIDGETGVMVESKQVGNQPVGSNLYGYNDLFEKLVDFLSTPIAKQTITKTSDAYTFSTAFDTKKFDALNRLNAVRPDFIDNSKNVITRTREGKEWFQNRALDAQEALKKFGAEAFVQNIENYAKSQTFKEALADLQQYIPALTKQNPDLVLSKINYLLDYLPIENFKDMFKHVNLKSFIIDRKYEFEKLLKKLTSVNSKDAKSYKEIFNQIVENYFPDIIESFGEGSEHITSGINKFMNFLEMPKSDKHMFIRKTPDGKIIAQKKDVKVEPDGTRTESNVEFELSDALSIAPQKERRDLLKKNEEFIKSRIKGDDDRKEINFLRLLFAESNPQDVQRNLKAEKEKFINYYNDPSHITKYNVIRGVHLPGIFEFYRIFNKGQVAMSSTVGEKEKPYYKFDLEDIRNPQVAKTVINFFAKLYNVDNPGTQKDSGAIYSILRDYVSMLEVAGESKEKMEEFITKYKPSSLEYYRGNNNPIPSSVYEKYYDFLQKFTSESNVVNDVKKNQEEIIKRAGLNVYNKLLKSLSKESYNVAWGDMVEYLGEEAEEWEYDTAKRRDVKVKKRVPAAFLDIGRKYEVTRVIPEEESGNILNSKIRVLNNKKQETDWMDTTDFKIAKAYITESKVVSLYVRKKLIELYLKTKNNE